MGYIKQLDSIRAIAVFLVIIWHWVPRNSLIENIHAGYLGVNIFFVLSGFLITQILFSNRCKAESSFEAKTNVLNNFYARRVLRIFPIYYLTILITIALNHRLALGVTKTEILSNVTYTTNFYIYLNKAWPKASLHFWSLAVEEQFYLAWPLMMLFIPKKSLVPTMLAFIAIGIVSQLMITNYEVGNLPTTTCLDCFGAGGLLAYIVVYRPNSLQKFYRYLSIVALAGLAVLIISWQFDHYFRNTRFIHAIIATWIINHILIYRNKGSVLVSLLSGNLLIFIGKVSYGIYLYHILYVYVASKLWYQYIFNLYAHLIDKQYEPWIFLAINFWILLLIAWLSWRFIEKPILSLKHRFKYRPN